MLPSGHISWFAEIGLGDRPRVGGKGGSLGELQRAGIAVPPGFVVRTGAFERFLQEIERTAPVRARVEALAPDDLPEIQACSRDLRHRIEAAALPADVAADIGSAHAALAGDARIPVAVRSSATMEDAADASFAGLQDTFLWVTTAADALDRVRSCWASLYSAESISYRRARRFPEA
ncbi:MAG: PEP/pyruvate-binding domain-containing protein, partial [Steroidobacteraceae bacterium]